ncbi:hypothetical protein ACFWFX_18660 [Streptomyces roseolus]|uniref:hypothetical protein n=1 Tax=Streptomyces roseolus TaxID=67358 RepID=UPI00364D856F
MSDLVAAGAPELPEGYFYRVRPTHLTAGFFVDVRRRRRFFGSSEMSSVVVYPSEYISAEEAIVRACRSAHARWEAEEKERKSYRDAERFLGDHDPRGGR